MSITKTNSEILNLLLCGQDLDVETSNTLMKRWLNDEILEVQTGAFLSALRAKGCLLYTSPSPRDLSTSRMPSSA